MMTAEQAAPETSTVAILLAAGGGRRFDAGTHKLLAPLRGRPVVAWSLDAVAAAGFAHVVVVTGAVPIDELVPQGLVVVHHPGWAAGQAGSLHAGLRAARDLLGAERVVVGLADQPFVEAGCWCAVAASSSRPIAVATYAGVRGNPVRLDRQVWALLPTEGDAGARPLMRVRPDLVEEVPCIGSAADIDTTKDLERWT